MSAEMKEWTGRELDAEVAEKVFGDNTHGCDHAAARSASLDSNLIRCDDCGAEFDKTGFAMEMSRLPRYSSDISAAWTVVEKLAAHPHRYVTVRSGGRDELVWECEVREYDADDPTEDARYYYARSDRAPEAICRASLQAVRGGGV